MTNQEPGQSAASAEALAAWVQASHATSSAKSEVWYIRRELREANKKLKAAQAAEDAADKTYLSTPYAEEQTA